MAQICLHAQALKEHELSRLSLEMEDDASCHIYSLHKCCHFSELKEDQPPYFFALAIEGLDSSNGHILDAKDETHQQSHFSKQFSHVMAS